MMQGHFGAAFLVSAVTNGAAPLPILFIASQIQDLLIAIFAYVIRIEVTRLSTTSGNKVYPFELLHIPYSHSLFTTIALSLLSFLAPTSAKANAAVAAAVLSHWLLDVVVHLPDLDVCFPFTNCGKAGLGLWRHLAPSLVVECVIVLVGFAMFVRRARSWKAARGVLLRLGPLVLFMVFVTVGLPFAPPPPMDWTIAAQTYVMYGLFAVNAWFGEKVLIARKEDAEEKMD